MKIKSPAHKINVVTLGCARNIVDSEILMKQIEKQGMEVVYDQDISDARTAIINTCGFIQDARQESIDTILWYAREKKEGRLDYLYVIGCLSERYMHELRKEIPEVDRYFGVRDMKAILEQLGADPDKEITGERKRITPAHYAYLKISEGCDRKCSFCAIPLIRGKQVSRSVEELKGEAEYLSTSGVKELILIAQDLTAYGTDLYGKRELARLLDTLVEIRGIEWIRLQYVHPAEFPENVLERIKSQPRICNYLDIPIQHISDTVLQKMHRGITRSEILHMLNKIREKLPGTAIRTTLLTGHPGEGEEEFRELKELVQAVRFERMGVFTYSEEEGTWGAGNLKDSIPSSVKQARLEELMQIQQSISFKINRQRIGTILKVIIDRQEGKYYTGRTEFDSPEVDNEIIVTSKSALTIGDFVNVHITEAGDYDLQGFAL